MTTDPYTPGGAPVPTEQAPPDTQPASGGTPQAEPASEPVWGYDPDVGPTLHGVPVYNFENPFGGHGFGILASLDLESRHEARQRRLINPGDERPEYEPIEPSGGAAYYYDLTLGKGWSIALGREGA